MVLPSNMYAASSEDTEAPPQPRPSPHSDEDEEEEEPEEEEEDEEAEVDGSGAHLHPPTVSLSSHNSHNSTHLMISAVSNLSSLSHLREIGKDALCWQLSSAKPGNGVEQVRDGNLDSYWQSDGTKQPHWIQVHFGRRVAVSHVCLYLDYALDESYTPKKIWVDHGMTHQDLQAAVYPESTEIEFQEPVGWCIVPLSSPPDPLDECQALDHAMETDTLVESRKLVRTHMLRISILSMHQNGRDTHIRQVELYGPRMSMGDMKSLLPHPSTTAAAAAHHPAMSSYRNINTDESMEEEDDLGELAFPAFGSIR